MKVVIDATILVAFISYGIQASAQIDSSNPSSHEMLDTVGEPMTSNSSKGFAIWNSVQSGVSDENLDGDAVGFDAFVEGWLVVVGILADVMAIP